MSRDGPDDHADALAAWIDRIEAIIDRGLQGDDVERALAEAPAAVAAQVRAIIAARGLFGAGAHGRDHAAALDAVPEIGSDYGPYRVLREIGRGGQAVVYLAEDTRLHRRVALKLLSHVGSEASDRVRRFRREAQLASGLHDPGICAVYDAGTTAGTAWIAMRYVEGETLHQRIARARTAAATAGHGRGPNRRDIFDVLKVIQSVAATLHAAHEAGVVHRDVKPANIMVTPTGEPVVLDFGLAAAGNAEASVLTMTGDVFGTPAYMSPEQVAPDRGAVGRQTDVWSLGVVLYECLAWCRPFDGATRDALYRAILHDVPLDVRRCNPAIPRDLATVVNTALAKNQASRYRTALDLEADLRRVIEGAPVLAKSPSLASRARFWVRRHPSMATAMAFVVLLAIVGGVELFRSWGHDLTVATGAWNDARLDVAHDLVHGLPRLVLRAHGDDHLTGLAAHETDPRSNDAVGRIIGELRQGDRMRAMIEAAKPLQVGGPDRDPIARAYLEQALRRCRGGAGSSADRPEVLAVFAQLLLEHPVQDDTEARAWEPCLAIVRSLSEPTVGTPEVTREERLQLLTILRGMGTPADAIRMLRRLPDLGSDDEERRLGVVAVAGIVCRARRGRALCAADAAALWDGLAPFAAELLGTATRPTLIDDPVHGAPAEAIRQVLMARPALGMLTEPPASWLARLHNLAAAPAAEPRPSGLTALLCAGGSPMAHPRLIASVQVLREFSHVDEWGRLVGHCGDRDTTADVRRTIAALPGIAPSQLASFDGGVSRGARELDGAAYDDPLDGDTLLGAASDANADGLPTVARSWPAAPATAGRLVAGWDFASDSAAVGTAGTAGEVTAVAAARSSEGPHRFLRLYRFGRSRVSLTFTRSPSAPESGRLQLCLNHERGERFAAAHRGVAVIRVELDGSLFFEETIECGREEGRPWDINLSRVPPGPHTITIYLQPRSTTTYRIFSVAIIEGQPRLPPATPRATEADGSASRR